jgi:hypothetical protein
MIKTCSDLAVNGLIFNNNGIPKPASRAAGRLANLSQADKVAKRCVRRKRKSNACAGDASGA